ncbi:hypothetical protein [Kutzneria kofuensis]|uniref:Uncharacterized protein n=1 Tax=Kutzneria kofuensis TaxID=103725 RepID=A0A7W9KPZ6_9PSEU|nr:hypothetical protein [Kutzneria kofuensis]MBB5896594.1 hypothetical protein [Kutzneria kofuensis]
MAAILLCAAAWLCTAARGRRVSARRDEDGHTQADLARVPGQPQHVGADVAQTAQGAVQVFDLAQPALGGSASLPVLDMPRSGCSPIWFGGAVPRSMLALGALVFGAFEGLEPVIALPNTPARPW